MCTYSLMIDNWRDRSWPDYPKYPPQTQPLNPIPWPVIQQDPNLAKQMLDILARLEALDKELGHVKCLLTKKGKSKIKRNLEQIAEQAAPYGK